MAEYIEGKHPVLEALKMKVPAQCLYVAQGAGGAEDVAGGRAQRNKTSSTDKTLSEITKRAHAQGISVRQVKKSQLDERSARGSHQGVMLQVKPYQYASAQGIIDSAQVHASQNNNSALIVVLDHITDAGNLGAVVRSAEIVGASGIIIPSKRSAHVTAATYKSSAGAVSHVSIAQVPNIAQFLERLKKADFWVAGATEQASECIWDAPLAGKLALVMGNEGSGLARLTQERCDFLVRIPQAGNIGSLNVAQAATVCMYEWMRQITA